MRDGTLPPALDGTVERVAALVERVEQAGEPPTQAEVLALLRDIDGIHRPGLRRLFRLIRRAGLEDEARADAHVRFLFELYDLDEGGERQRAEAVLELLRPEVEAHGGRLDVVEAAEESLKVRLSAAGVGAAHLAQVGERVEHLLLDALPGLERVEVAVESLAAAPQPAGFVPLSSVQLGGRRGVIWERALTVDEVLPGQVRAVELRGQSILIANVDGEFYAYRNVCPDSTLPLTDAQVTERTLICPWHGCRFDLRGGRRLRSTGPGLGVMPIRVHNDEIRLGRLELAAP